MAELPWSGVRYCFEALPRPTPRQTAVEAVARRGNLRASTAARYLSAAMRLRLVTVDTEGWLALAAPARAPEELLPASTLLRLFRAWQALEPEPVRRIRREAISFRVFGIDGLSRLETADALARHINGPSKALAPEPALLLELARLWNEAQKPSRERHLWSAVDAFKLFGAMVQGCLDIEGPLIERFVHAGMKLYGRNLIRLGIVQYALDANQPYAPFRTSLGYIKWLYDPIPFEGSRHAQPVQATRKLISSG